MYSCPIKCPLFLPYECSCRRVSTRKLQYLHREMYFHLLCPLLDRNFALTRQTKPHQQHQWWLCKNWEKVSLISPKLSTGAITLSLKFLQIFSTVPYWVSLNKKNACNILNRVAIEYAVHDNSDFGYEVEITTLI